MPSFKKLLRKYFILCCAVIAFVIILKRPIYYNESIPHTSKFLNTNNNLEGVKNLSLKLILIWTTPHIDPIMHLRDGLDTVIGRNCSSIRCFVSSNRLYVDNVANFDAIIFHGPNINFKDLPRTRSINQKYIFASMESSHNYPICHKIFNNYFNWTWTYKLVSDEYYGYISIRNKNNALIGPKEVMQWIKVKEMQPIGDILKKKLSTKKYAAAWFVSNCNTKSKRENIASKLSKELGKYNLSLDIYGRCDVKKCSRNNMTKCLELLAADYYFYLAFENSLSTDYVTEKLLHALQHYTVPVVYGGANYTRFMPDGIYLDARKLTVSKLAKRMAELIEDKEKYYNYFKWHNHYSYHYVHESPETDSYCKLCSMISNEKRFSETSVYPNFIDWWNENNQCKIL